MKNRKNISIRRTVANLFRKKTKKDPFWNQNEHEYMPVINGPHYLCSFKSILTNHYLFNSMCSCN
ncbi:hypothetical protein DERF_006844 [Dermatophagoides farinae]|uniref:Uncharacterized protein n=1 Tax=Dermatophagoides farinae TaxID=6954 RepID=A0A922HZ83_DERFA|nr:hypothetical protein DERF_006844 [Dermatophagoides farinae]